MACCDICDPDIFTIPPAEAYTKPSRAKPKFTVIPYERSSEERGLRSALVTFRRELFKEVLAPGMMLTPQALMSTDLLDRIVDLAHYHKINTLDDLRQQISWTFTDSHGPKILRLITQHLPSIQSSPFVSTPLQWRTRDALTSAPASPSPVMPAKRQIKCGACSAVGHNRELQFICYNLLTTTAYR